MSKRDREAVHRGLDDVFASEGSDLLNNVIQSDRRRAGRIGSPLPGDDVSPAGKFELSYDNQTGQPRRSEYDHQTDVLADNPASQLLLGPTDRLSAAAPLTVPKRTASSSRKRKNSTEPNHLLTARITEGRRLADTPTTTVTLRLPRGLNDWLDEYVHRAWPERVRKQELVAEALRMLLVRRGRPGEPVLDTEFLREEEP
jgi:hypothetical protein